MTTRQSAFAVLRMCQTITQRLASRWRKQRTLSRESFDRCRIRVVPFVEPVESGTQGSAHQPGGIPMHYFALLLGPEGARPADPDEQAAEMAAYQAFHASAASAIRAADALLPSATGVRITGGPDKPSITDGPFAESAEVAGGYYVFEADNLDDAIALARDIPAAK